MKPKFLAAAVAASAVTCTAAAANCTTITDGMTISASPGQVRDLCLGAQNGRIQEVEAGASADWKVGVAAWRDRVIVLRTATQQSSPVNVLVYTDRGERYELHLIDQPTLSGAAQSAPPQPAPAGAK